MGKKIAGDYFQVLPEECISNIISSTLISPGDACRSSLVSSIFKSVADSDLVWEKFLPSDLKEIISKSVSPVVSSSNKDLFLCLCNHPILIDEGKMNFWLEKWSGRKCFMVAARELWIVWADSPQYWSWISLPESRFREVAKLGDVCWLEIHGSIYTQTLSPKTIYAVYLVFKFTERTHGLEFPVKVNVQVGGVVVPGTRRVYLDPDGSLRKELQNSDLRGGDLVKREKELPLARKDEWLEIWMGDFVNDEGENRHVDMSLLGEDGTSWKSGLVVQGIELRPKSPIY
ncbi:hypothetical protein HHK36_032224 [Tetracentron sinense]|uniref:F-box domain-containing protein n=1 Tax=Tetracentron sinense TaxID=13715 RepID=A0A834YAM9_TETSI|nr:hypothetical protein HHK36_032224 [Tetracentron sinense]